MAINYRGRDYTPEDILKLPDEEKKKIFAALQAEMNNHPNPIEDEEILINGDYLQEKEEIPETELHSIKNPKAAKMLEQLITSGKSTVEAIETIKNHFSDLDNEPEDDKEFQKLKKELDSIQGVPPQQKAKIIGYALAHGISAQEAVSEVQVKLNKWSIKKAQRKEE